MKRLHAFCFLSVFLMLTAAAGAADVKWPTKPVTVVVGYTPGGMSDVSTRLVCDALQSRLGQPVVVQNKGGAGGMLGMNSVAQAAPDGYTLYGGSVSQPLAIGAFNKKKEISINDFESVGGFLPHERALFIQNDAPFSNWEEFVEYVKKNPDTVSIGFGGGMWSLEVLRYVAHKEGLSYKLVPYKSGGDASADFFGRHIDIAELGVGTAVYQAAVEGKAKVLIDMAGDKVPGFENVPRLIDKGYNFPVLSEYGLLFPKNTPRPIVEKMEAALRDALNDPALLEKLRNLGSRPRFLDGATFAKAVEQALNSIPVLVEYNDNIKK